MARNKDSNRSGIVSSILSIVAGVALGVVLAIVALVFKPVTVLNPEDVGKAAAKTGDKPAERPLASYNNVVVIRGKMGVPRTPQSTARQRAVIEKNPAGVELIEEDVNRWIAAAYGSKDLAFSSDSERKLFKPKLPSVRIDGNEIELLLETAVGDPKKVEPDPADKTPKPPKTIPPFNFVVHARGTIEIHDGKPVFVAHSMHVGSCPVYGAAQAKVLEMAMEPLLPIPENVAAAWAAARDVKIEESRLKFAFN